jgi:putative endonuclease
MSTPETKKLTVYILRCRDGTYYPGLTTDLSHALKWHSGSNGPEYTRKRLPVTVVYTETGWGCLSAQASEHQLKKMSAAQIEARIAKQPLVSYDPFFHSIWVP